MKGKLIVIDGVDGAGKATQTKLLLRRLKKVGRKVRTISFPQHGTRSAAVVDDYLNGKYGKPGPYVASLFYAVDRFDASFKIRKWLAEGYHVICDRYVTANAGHQGGKIVSQKERVKFFHWLQNLEYKICALPQPDINFIFFVPVPIAHALIAKKDHRIRSRAYIKNKRRDIHENDERHLEKAEASYRDVARVFPKTVSIECAEKNRLLPPAEISELIWRHVQKILSS